MGGDPAGEIHLREEPAAENIAGRIGVRRHGDGAQGRLASTAQRRLTGHLDLLQYPSGNYLLWHKHGNPAVSCLCLAIFPIVQPMPDLFDDNSGRKSGSGYSAKDIEVLEGLEPVRRRPGMYIGGTDERALHHLVAE